MDKNTIRHRLFFVMYWPFSMLIAIGLIPFYVPFYVLTGKFLLDEVLDTIYRIIKEKPKCDNLK